MGARASLRSSRQERRFISEPLRSLGGLPESHATQGGREQLKDSEENVITPDQYLGVVV